MGYKLTKLPQFLDKWGVPTSYHPGWETRSRKSGDFDDLQGIIIHHDASGARSSLRSALGYAYGSAKDGPIGNGFLRRPKDGLGFVLAAIRATNTAGKGGPMLSSRGVIPRDTANSRTFNIEAQNNGRGEAWSDAMCDMYVRLVCAVIDCINNTVPGKDIGAGDVWAHFEWTNRKIDPFGPSKFNGYTNKKWDMNKFRGAVFLQLIAGPGGKPAPVKPTPPKPTPPKPTPPKPTPPKPTPPKPKPPTTPRLIWPRPPKVWKPKFSGGVAVRSLQSALNTTNDIWKGKNIVVDGVYGKQTQDAVRELQYTLVANKRPVSVDGNYGPETYLAAQRFTDDLRALRGK